MEVPCRDCCWRWGIGTWGLVQTCLYSRALIWRALLSQNCLFWRGQLVMNTLVDAVASSGAMAITFSWHLSLPVPLLSLVAVASDCCLAPPLMGDGHILSVCQTQDGSEKRGWLQKHHRTVRSKDPPKPREVPLMIVSHWDLIAVCLLLLLLILEKEVPSMRMHYAPSAITTWAPRAWFGVGDASQLAGSATVDGFNAPSQGRHTYDARPNGHVMALLLYAGNQHDSDLFVCCSLRKDQWESTLSLPILSAKAYATLLLGTLSSWYSWEAIVRLLLKSNIH